MAYLGNDLQVAFPTYRNIDDISGSFNGVTTSFPLTVAGVAPIPAPINSQQCLISVNGVVQRPDDSGAEGFRLSGGNIIFASAPAGGVDFFGVILAGADYVNIGANFPSGTAVAPSITFDSDLDTGIYNPAGNQIGFTTSGVQRLVINSSGQISGGLGTAAAPVISFISDPNTGIYSPGADQVAISTGGSGRLFVDANGNVGVGVSPSNYAGYNNLVQNGSSGSTFEQRIAGALVGSLTAAGDVSLRSVTAIPLTLHTNNTERLRITSAGLVGVGTSSPGYLLDVVSSGASDIRVKSGGAGSAYLRLGTATRDHTIYSDASTGSLVAYDITSAATRLVIDSSGRVGIGTSSPSQLLTTVGNIKIAGAQASNNAKLCLTRTDRSWSINNETDLRFYNGSGDTDSPPTASVVFSSSGSVGIGTTSPGYALHVSGTGAVSSRTFATDATGDASFFVQNDGNGICGPLVYGSTKTAYGALASNETAFYSNRSTTIMADGGSAVIKFATGGNNERLRITSAGLVGVGTSSPASLLTSYAGNVSTLGAKASTGLLIENNGSVGNISQIGLGYTFSSTNHPIAIAAVTTSGAGSTRADLVFATRDLTTDVAPTERMRITSGGFVAIGTSSATELLNVNGHSFTGSAEYYTAARTRTSGVTWYKKRATARPSSGQKGRATITFSASSGSPNAFHKVRVTQAANLTLAFYEFLVAESSGTFSIVNDNTAYNKAQFTISMSSPVLTIDTGTVSTDWGSMTVEVETFEMGDGDITLAMSVV